MCKFYLFSNCNNRLNVRRSRRNKFFLVADKDYTRCKGKGKVLRYLLPSVGDGADPSVLAVSLQVTF